MKKGNEIPSFFSFSSQFIQLICSIKSEIRCLISIYVYCDETVSFTKRIQLENWARNNEPLITDIYPRVSNCFTQLSKDIHEICDHNSIPMTFLNISNENGNLKQSSSFLIFHFFLNSILSRLSSSSFTTNHQNILRSCLSYYRDNERFSQEIEHFRDAYSSRSPIDWYLQTKFLTRLLHKSIRTLNFSMLFNYSFIFHDIEHYLRENLSSFVDVPSLEIYYRAQNLNADELYRLRTSMNEIISINRYLDLCQTAEQAMKEISLTSKTLETVLYHFSIRHSYIPLPEKKILLRLGTLFRLERIGMEIDGIWHVYLQPVRQAEIEEQIDRLMKEIDVIPHECLSIGLIWDRLKESAKAERFYRLLLEHFPLHDDQRGIICNSIGSIFRSKCQYSFALTCHEQALKFYQEKHSSNASCQEEIDRTYAQLGLVYRETGDLTNAIECFQSASHLGEDILASLGEIYRNLGQFDLAYQYYQQTKVHNNIGLCFLYQRMFPQALSHFRKEPESISCINLAIYYQFQKDYSTALIYFDKALETVRNHPLDTAMIHSYLGVLYCDQRQWLLSLKHYEQALELYKRHLPTNNHPTIALIHDGIGTLYLNKGEYRAAQRQLQRCLELQLRVLPSQHPDIAGTYNNLGGVFNEMGHYEQALLYHSEALAIAMVTLPVEHVDIKLYEHNIAETKRKLSYN